MSVSPPACRQCPNIWELWHNALFPKGNSTLPNIGAPGNMFFILPFGKWHDLLAGSVKSTPQIVHGSLRSKDGSCQRVRNSSYLLIYGRPPFPREGRFFSDHTVWIAPNGIRIIPNKTRVKKVPAINSSWHRRPYFPRQWDMMRRTPRAQSKPTTSLITPEDVFGTKASLPVNIRSSIRAITSSRIVTMRVPISFFSHHDFAKMHLICWVDCQLLATILDIWSRKVSKVPSHYLESVKSHDSTYISKRKQRFNEKRIWVGERGSTTLQTH